MSTTAQESSKNQQAHATVRATARRIPTATRPLYRHAQTALHAAAQRCGVTCLTQADDKEALLLGIMRLEQALYQSFRFQGHALRRREQTR